MAAITTETSVWIWYRFIFVSLQCHVMWTDSITNSKITLSMLCRCWWFCFWFLYAFVQRYGFRKKTETHWRLPFYIWFVWNDVLFDKFSIKTKEKKASFIVLKLIECEIIEKKKLWFKSSSGNSTFSCVFDWFLFYKREFLPF